MSGKVVVFAVVFIVLFGFTLWIPALPPGNLIFDFLGIPEITMSFLEISGTLLVYGIINGLIWGIIALGIYGLARLASDTRPLSSLPAPPQLPTPPPEPTPIARESRVRSYRPSVRIRRTYVSLNQGIERIEGIGPTYGTRLRNSGVRTVNDLLRLGSSGSGRRRLAYEIDVAPSKLLKWVFRADFFRIRGIGKQYSSLLESAGVNTLTDLSNRNPIYLYNKLSRINREKRLVRRIPPLRTIEDWIRKAKNLESIIIY